MKKRISSLLAATAVVCTLGVSSPAFSQDSDIFAKERFLIRGRVIGVMPDSGGSTSINGQPDADNAVVPEVDFSYFFTKNIAAELILATSPHDLSADNTNLGDLDLGDTMILPPTLTLQYHFTPEQTFSPYVGAGVNYTMTYAEDNGADTAQLEADNSFGWAVQAGADYWLGDHWGLNVDLKKIWVDVDASINNGAITGNVELNPWILGAGVSYRF